MAPEYEPFYEAWETLRHDRQFGAMGGVSRIPFSAIDLWARRYEVDGEEFDLFVTLIAAIDDEFIAWLAKQKPSKDKPNGPAT